MPTTITGAVRLPDGTTPDSGRVIFTRRKPLYNETIIPDGSRVEAIITGGNITISLNGGAPAGEPPVVVYGVEVEVWREGLPKPTVSRLPDIVIPTGDASGDLQDFAAVQIPRGATNTHVVDQGETLDVALRYLDENLRPVSIADVTITSWIAQGGVRTPLTVTKIDAAEGTFEITLTASQTLPLSGRYDWAVRMAAGGRVKITTGILIVNEVR